jgi:hypothetical protein
MHQPPAHVRRTKGSGLRQLGKQQLEAQCLPLNAWRNALGVAQTQRCRDAAIASGIGGTSDMPRAQSDRQIVTSTGS